MKLPLLQVDFDQTIAARDGELLDGALEGLRQLHKWYRLVVLTARADPEPVWAVLRRHNIAHWFDDVSNVKQRGLILDDRAIHFTDWETALAALDPRGPQEP